MKNVLGSNGKRADQMEERTSKLENKNLEMIQAEEEREKIFFLVRNIGPELTSLANLHFFMLEEDCP